MSSSDGDLHHEDCCHGQDVVCCTCDLLDEIERLRAEVRQCEEAQSAYVAENRELEGVLTEKDAEIDRLRALWDAARLHDNVAHACGELHRMEVPDE